MVVCDFPHRTHERERPNSISFIKTPDRRKKTTCKIKSFLTNGHFHQFAVVKCRFRGQIRVPQTILPYDFFLFRLWRHFGASEVDVFQMMRFSQIARTIFCQKFQSPVALRENVPQTFPLWVWLRSMDGNFGSKGEKIAAGHVWGRDFLRKCPLNLHARAYKNV